MQDGIKNHRRGVAFKGMRSGGHLIEHCPERKKIGAAIQFFAARLLGRHVGNGAYRRPRASNVFLAEPGSRSAHRCGCRGMRRGQLGEAKIENFRLVAVGDKNVGRLNVAMDDGLRVRGL